MLHTPWKLFGTSLQQIFQVSIGPFRNCLRGSFECAHYLAYNREGMPGVISSLLPVLCREVSNKLWWVAMEGRMV